MSWGDSAPRSVLILGGGDGLAVREVLKYETVDHIDLVDIDPEITNLGRDFAPIVRLNQLAMKIEHLNVYNADAFSFVKDTDVVYDRIIIDFPDPHNEALYKLYSIESYAMVNVFSRPMAYWLLN